MDEDKLTENDEVDPPKLEQSEIDALNMEELNKANRLYRKCFAGKCPPAVDPYAKKTPKVIRAKKLKRFISKRFQDKNLCKVWVENGRIRRLKALEVETKELKTKIIVASGKTHLLEQEKNFKQITLSIKNMERMDEEINKAKFEIAHLKSQIIRLTKRDVELGLETESEDQFSTHLRKANRQLEIYEGRVQMSRQQECLMTNENKKLRQLINDMLLDRAVFNRYWSKLVENLKDRRKFLLDMIERSSQAFNQGADFLDNLKQLQARRARDRHFHITEMVNLERKIDANQIMSLFLGGKGKQREMTPLEPREILRRENFKDEHSRCANMYNEIIEHMKQNTETSEIMKAVEVYMRQENDGFQFFNFLNEINHQVEYFTHNFFTTSSSLTASKDYNDRKLEYYDQRIKELDKMLEDEINKSLKMKIEREKKENEFEQYFGTIMDILKLLDCDLSPLDKLLGDHKKINVNNIVKFISLLELRTNEVLAFAYRDQRKTTDMFEENPKLVVRSFKRTDQNPIKIESIITTQQCAECAESEEVNRFDDKIIYPLDREAIQVNMRKKTEASEIQYRLHNLSKCNLPRSGMVAGRRYAE